METMETTETESKTNNSTNVTHITDINEDTTDIIDRARLRGKIVTKGRTTLNRKIRNGTYIEFLLKENGVLNEKEVITDKSFLDDIVHEIEKNRAKTLVYTPAYKRQYLDEWIENRDKKERKKRLADKIKGAGGSREGSYV